MFARLNVANGPVRPGRDGFRRWAAALLLGLTLLLCSGDALHSLFHDHAHAPDHECAFVHWANAEIGFTQAGTLPPPRDHVVSEPAAQSVCVLLPCLVRLPESSRGPPRA